MRIENLTKMIASPSWTANQFDLKLRLELNVRRDDMEDLDHFQEWVIHHDHAIWLTWINYLTILNIIISKLKVIQRTVRADAADEDENRLFQIATKIQVGGKVRVNRRLS